MNSQQGLQAVAVAGERAWQGVCPLPATLDTSWRRSRDTLAAIRERLHQSGLPQSIVTVALSGSLGRMEQTAHSDADLIVVLDETASRDASAARASVEAVWACLKGLDLPQPLADGIYARASYRADLLAAEARGQIAADVTCFGHRIQLLLDAQPVYGVAACLQLREAILEWYGSADAAVDPATPWIYLVNDLVRYAKCLSIDTQWKHRQDAARSALYYLKLVFSRRVMITGLLFLLAESHHHRRGNVVEWLSPRLSWTPLERLAHVLESHQQIVEIREVLSLYDAFLHHLGSDRFRACIDKHFGQGAQLSRSDGLGHREVNAATLAVWSDRDDDYASLVTASERLGAVLIDFALARRADWPDRFWTTWLLN